MGEQAMSQPQGGNNTTLLVIVALAVIFFVVTAVAFGYLVVFGENLAGPPQDVYTLTLTEYEIASSPEPIIVKVGEPVVFRIVNEGAVEHEVMFVPDLEQMAEMLKMAAERIMAQNPELSEEEVIELVEIRHEEVMEEMIVGFFGDAIRGDELMIELEPGESTVATFTFTEPGIYIIACMKQLATFPETHAEQGMFNQIIVVEG